MSQPLTAIEVAGRVGAPVEQIEEWRRLGLIGHRDSDSCETEDVERARIIQFLLRRSVDLTAIVRADREEQLLARHLELLFPDGVGQTYSFDQVAQELGLPRPTVQWLVAAADLADRNGYLYARDVEALRACKIALDAGIPEEAVAQLARVYADGLGRLADAETRLFHYYVHEPLKARGVSGADLIDAVRTSSSQVTPIVEPLMRYFHARGWEKALREDAVLHVREHAGMWEKPEVPGQMRAAIAFVDLSGFTSLAEAMGDEAAARVLERFSQLVREATGRSDGRVVKQIGDAFMLVFSEARSALMCALEIERDTAAEPQFPAVRTGIHWGPVLYREGDYYGTSVNIAARVAAQAERHQLLLTAALRSQVGPLPDVEFVPLGQRRFRGLAEQLELFAVLHRTATDTEGRLIDPVCGMELRRDEAAAVLSLLNQERVFCSQPCLNRFVAAPQLYLTR